MERAYFPEILRFFPPFHRSVRPILTRQPCSSSNLQNKQHNCALVNSFSVRIAL